MGDRFALGELFRRFVSSAFHGQCLFERSVFLVRRVDGDVCQYFACDAGDRYRAACCAFGFVSGERIDHCGSILRDSSFGFGVRRVECDASAYSEYSRDYPEPSGGVEGQEDCADFRCAYRACVPRRVSAQGGRHDQYAGSEACGCHGRSVRRYGWGLVRPCETAG